MKAVEARSDHHCLATSWSPQPETLSIKPHHRRSPNPERFLLGELSLAPTAISGVHPLSWTYDPYAFLSLENINRAEQAARELTERGGLLQRIRDLGNAFEPVDDAFYQFRPKAFELNKLSSKDEPPLSPTTLPLWVP
jgi:hypothetical protein